MQPIFTLVLFHDNSPVGVPSPRTKLITSGQYRMLADENINEIEADGVLYTITNKLFFNYSQTAEYRCFVILETITKNKDEGTTTHNPPGAE